MILKDVERFEAYDCNTNGCAYSGESLLAYVEGMQHVLEDLDIVPTIDPESMPVIKQLREEIDRLNHGIENLSKAVEIAYKQRDAAVEQLRGDCRACKNYTENHCYGPCAGCKYEYYQYRCIDARDHWEWRGVKEDRTWKG